MANGGWERIEELFHQAAELPPAERPAFLSQVCGDDQELRRELESLLAADMPEGSGLFQAAVAGAAEQLPAPSSEETELTGKRIGRYSIAELIGKGGMGAVYRAVREDDFRMQVAVKLLKRGTDTDMALRRFRAERQILAGLQHPNIARLLDGGAAENGLPYLVMEYVDGTPLLEYARKLSLRQRLELFRSVCSAVQYAHDNQIVHRDIKPANILVTSDGVPKLLDFGIAKLLDPTSDGEAMALTATGARLMTPHYASPEQVRGEPITTATDVYSLGAVLYELLTDQRVHTIEGQTPGEIEQAVCNREPKKPSSIAKQLGKDLDKIVLRALRKEPERRYASVQDLSEDLDRFLHDLPVEARGESVIYRSRKFLKRNRALIVAAALSAVVVLALVAALDRFTGPSLPVRSIAVLPFENLSGDSLQEPFVDGMTEALIAGLSNIKALRVTARDSVMRYKGSQKPASLKARELNASALVEGTALRSGDRMRVNVRLRAGDLERVSWTQTYESDWKDAPLLQSQAAIAIAREIQIQLTPQEEARLSPKTIVNREAYAAYLRGRYHSYKYTREGFEKGLQHYKDSVEIDPAFAQAWAGLASGYFEMSGMYLQPREAVPMAKAAALRALTIDENLAEAHDLLATIQSQYDWDWNTAEMNYRRAIELNPSLASGRRHYSFYLIQQARINESIREMEEAYRLDPLPPLIGTNLGWIYYLSRRTDQAIAQYRKIIELDPTIPMTHYSLAIAYQQKRMFEPAIAAFLKARDLDKGCNECLAFLGHAYAVSGRNEDARRILEQRLDLSRQRYVDPYNMALIYIGIGEPDNAFEWIEKAIEQRSEQLLILKVDPRLDRIREDARYKSLVRRIGLPL